MTFPISRIFLHFFDTHFFDAKSRANPNALAEARLATHLALMLCERVYLPAASYVENPQCRSIVDEHKTLFADGVIVLVGGEETLADYATAKLLQYDEGTARHLAYRDFSGQSAAAPGFRSRSRATTAEIGAGWRFRAADLSRIVRNLPDTKEARTIEANWDTIPDALTHRAFITDNVVPLLGVKPDPTSDSVIRARVSHVINDEYFSSFIRELDAAVLTDLVSFAGFDPDPTTMRLEYSRFRRDLVRAGLLHEIMQADSHSLRSLHERKDVSAVILPLLGATSARVLRPSQLELPIGPLKPAVERLAKIKSGKKNATAYARAVESIFNALFPFSLEEGSWEHPVDDGRKRIDILFPNVATSGAFGWAQQNFSAKFLAVECKNYTDDPSNAEVDQLAGRMTPHRTMFGVLACRTAKDLDRLIVRCVNFKRNQNLLLVPLVDADLVEMANGPHDPGVSELSKSLIGRRMLEIASA